ncbi:ferredoxin [Candidatus Woesearchaeota archaeon]|nr:ferredoxin [Candidatus Woesearchaeota archaeon]
MSETPKIKYKIVHDRPGCIGCSACVVVAEKYWEMKEDSKSSIKHEKMQHVGEEEHLEHDEDYELNLEAAQTCPVNVIHIEKDGKREL